MYQQSLAAAPLEELEVSTINPLPRLKFLHTRNARMQCLIDQVERIATTQATVLIQGENGTGKEVFAQAIHAASRRRHRPFVRVNCAALPDGVLESELFGHEKGAFTGATRQRPGRFELAHGGTLFLDEIGAADIKMQLRLLRVLQEREFERVGGTQTLKVDVRVIAATNVEMTREVELGNFREDLFYRLNVLPIKLPALRERAEDVPLLIRHFLKQAGRKNHNSVKTIDKGAIDLLQTYSWPGNIRQLENVIEYMVILAHTERLTTADIPQEIIDGPGSPMVGSEEIEETGSLLEARTSFERRFLCEALRRRRGVIARVAQDIGMSRKNLYTKLETLNIDYERFRS